MRFVLVGEREKKVRIRLLSVYDATKWGSGAEEDGCSRPERQQWRRRELLKNEQEGLSMIRCAVSALSQQYTCQASGMGNDAVDTAQQAAS